jgi:hypothetical protein
LKNNSQLQSTHCCIASGNTKVFVEAHREESNSQMATIITTVAVSYKKKSEYNVPIQ